MKVVLWLCAALVAGFYIVGPIQDPDLWWHITVGRWILAHTDIPHQDLWGMFSHGQPWRAYSWSNEIIYALAERWWGIQGLLSLKLVLAAALSISLCAVFSKLSKDWFVGLLLGIFACVSCFNHYTLRPQSLIWIVFAWLLLVADNVEREGVKRTSRLALIGLMAVWANTHLSAVLGVGAVLLWVYGSGPLRSGAVRAGHAFLWAFLGTLITPYLGGEWLTFFAKSGHPLEFRAIAEFQPATVTQYSTVFLIVSCLLLAVLVTQRPRILPPGKLILWAGFCIGSLAIVKFLPFAVILTCALIARGYREQRAEGAGQASGRERSALANLMEAVERFRAFVLSIPAEGLSFVFICMSAVSVYKVWKEPLAFEVVPQLAVDFIQKHNLPAPIANIFGHGGYLMYRFSDAEGNPGRPVAIDGRTNLIAKDLWRKYNATYSGKRTWKEYLDIVKPETILWRDDSPLGSLLVAEGIWCEIFSSGPERSKVSVFAKRSYVEAHRDEFPASSCDSKP